MGMANRKTPYTDKNPGGQMPALELDDGTVIGETVAICEYLEDVHPTPTLIGSTPQRKGDAPAVAKKSRAQHYRAHV